MSEITEPPNDPVREAKEHDLDDPADVQVDPEVLRQGGPTDTPGAITTTGGRAGPAMRRATGQRGTGKIAPTTTGDATTGGMRTPAGGSTSDASTGGNPAPNADRPTD